MDFKILQLDDNFTVLDSWNSVKEIAESPKFKTQRTSFDQALRKRIKAHGFYWMYESDYNQGIRPDDGKQKRNIIIYVYLPILGKKLEVRKEPMINGYSFVSAYKNAVIASNILGISVSNIRSVCNKIKKLHKGYFFSYEPLNEIDRMLGEVQIIERRIIDNEGDPEYWNKELEAVKEKYGF